jgi:hypothetical protein
MRCSRHVDTHERALKGFRRTSVASPKLRIADRIGCAQEARNSKSCPRKDLLSRIGFISSTAGQQIRARTPLCSPLSANSTSAKPSVQPPECVEPANRPGLVNVSPCWRLGVAADRPSPSAVGLLQCSEIALCAMCQTLIALDAHPDRAQHERA